MAAFAVDQTASLPSLLEGRIAESALLDIALELA